MVLDIAFPEVQEAGGKEEDGGAGLRILLQQARLKQMTSLGLNCTSKL